MPFILAHTSGDFISGRGRTKNKKEAKRFSTRAEAVAYKGNKVVSEEDPDYKEWSVMEVRDSVIDKAIKVVDALPGSKNYGSRVYIEKRFARLDDALDNALGFAEEAAYEAGRIGDKRLEEKAKKAMNLIKQSRSAIK